MGSSGKELADTAWLEQRPRVPKMQGEKQRGVDPVPPRGLPGSRSPGSAQRVGVLGVGVVALPGGPGHTEVEWGRGAHESWPKAPG